MDEQEMGGRENGGRFNVEEGAGWWDGDQKLYFVSFVSSCPHLHTECEVRIGRPWETSSTRSDTRVWSGGEMESSR